MPPQKRARTKVLRGEFFQALDKVADEVGLQADMIRFTYLDPGLEVMYTNDGTSAVKTAACDMAARIAARFLTGS